MNKSEDETLEERARRVLGRPSNVRADEFIDAADIEELRGLGFSMEQIGELFDVSRMTIYRVWRGPGYYDQARLRNIVTPSDVNLGSITVGELMKRKLSL